MKTQLEIVKHRLFDQAGLRATDIKLFPGDKPDLTPEEMAEQVNKALTQIAAGDFELVEDFGDE